jgi:hypothetical protein
MTLITASRASWSVSNSLIKHFSHYGAFIRRWLGVDLYYYDGLVVLGNGALAMVHKGLFEC